MFQLPDYFHSLSLRLTEVLDEIGVNQPMLLRRRRSLLRHEVIEEVVFMEGDVSAYCFGSQIEGTTTLGLRSDYDRLFCVNQVNVIQDWSEWCYGTCNLLMLQDETTAPGYCKLQMLRSDVPLPADKRKFKEDIFDNCGRVLMKNTFLHYAGKTIVIKGPSTVVQETYNRHGPAHSNSADGLADIDRVCAFRCKTWRHTEHPHIRHMQHQWPSNILSNIGEESGCFLVPVGHRLSYNEFIEWRISPSLQERQLMFSMNITQVRCYILLKMIVKHYINPFIPKCISSFHCKTTLFWCKEITNNDFWRDDNLFTCIIFCLINLLQCIKTNYCPQFLIPQENLFAGKVKANDKQLLIRIIKNIIMSNGRFLFDIPFDDVGQRLSIKCNTDLQHEHNVESSFAMCLQIVETIALNECCNMSMILKIILKHIISSSDDVSVQIYNTRTLIYRLLLHLQGQHASYIQQAINQLLRFLYTTLGSLMSSKSLYEGNGVPRQALSWFTYGLDSDVASSRLKLASILYCSGDLYNAMLVLLDIERRYDTDYVKVVCGCYDHPKYCNYNFGMKVFSTEQYTRYTAFCVRFLRSEMFCVPPALQYEMFRSTGDDVQHRDKDGDAWMDWAVVDSLPYLYYLQYMTYRQMGRRDDQYRALDNIQWSINHNVNLGHGETAWNLLGTCMELEERAEEAFYCYRRSLDIRSRYNAANRHNPRLLSQIRNI